MDKHENDTRNKFPRNRFSHVIKLIQTVNTNKDSVEYGFDYHKSTMSLCFFSFLFFCKSQSNFRVVCDFEMYVHVYWIAIAATSPHAKISTAFHSMLV